MSEPLVEPLTPGEPPAEPSPTEAKPGEEPQPGSGEAAADEPDDEPAAGEQPTPGEGEPGEGNGEPVQPTPEMSEREFEKRFSQLERRGKTWVELVEGFIADTEQPLVRCAVCLDQAPGFHFHPDLVPLSEEQVMACRLLAGLPVEPAFEPDPESHECETCLGWGRVKTGSKVAGKAVVSCPRCNGHGFISSRPVADVLAVPVHANGSEAVSVLSEDEQAGEDAWGTPRSHPDWGKSPQYRSPTWQAELDAYKQGQPAPVA